MRLRIGRLLYARLTSAAPFLRSGISRQADRLNEISAPGPVQSRHCGDFNLHVWRRSWSHREHVHQRTLSRSIESALSFPCERYGVTGVRQSQSNRSFLIPLTPPRHRPTTASRKSHRTPWDMARHLPASALLKILQKETLRACDGRHSLHWVLGRPSWHL